MSPFTYDILYRLSVMCNVIYSYDILTVLIITEYITLRLYISYNCFNEIKDIMYHEAQFPVNLNREYINRIFQ